MQHSITGMRRGILLVLLYVFLTPFCTFYMQAGTVLEPPQATVSGTVTDTSGNPLAGVNLVVESKHIGTVSGLDGSFSVNAEPTDVLVFSMVGFKTLTVPIAGRGEVLVSLEEDVTVLGEVVLNAGYYTVSERERTGSIEKVTALDIEKQPISNPLAALQGRMAGVVIQQTSGLTGSNFNIRIRGRNSIRSDANEPLYIVDGMPYSSTSLGHQQTSGTALPGGAISPLNNLNPTDIESIEVLKDADATAIYRSRGANGVVLITTKKGSGGKTKVELNMQTGMGKVTNMLDLLTTPEYLALRREGYANDGIDPLPANAYDVNGTWSPDRYTDWQKELFGKTAYLTNAQASVSGGDERTQFLVSGNYHKQTNVYLGNYHNSKISGMASLHHGSENGKFDFNLSTTYSSNKNNLPGIGLVLSAMTLAPNAPALYDENGDLNWENSTWSNPVANLERKYRSTASTLINHIGVGYKIMGALEIRASLGYTRNDLSEINTTPSTIYDPVYGAGPEFSNAFRNTGKRTSWVVEPQLDYVQDFGDLRLSALTGLTFQEQKSEGMLLYASGFTSNTFIENFSAASVTAIMSNATQQYRYQALYGRVNLGLKGRYFLNVTGRRDGSSRFGPEKRFANFGAVGAAWVFSGEAAVQSGFPFLSFGKLRASYGTSGSDQIGDYQYLDTYSFSSAQYQGTVGLHPTRLYNPDYSWESNRKLELALELNFFDDRIMLQANHYRNRSSNQLVGIPMPTTTGFASVNANLDATVENTGWELVLNTHNIRSKDMEWTTSVNLTVPQNKLVSFPDLEGSTYANSLVIGKPLDIIKVYQLEGVDLETGVYTFTDLNGDGAISSIGDRQIIRYLGPKYFGGLNNSLSFGKFRLDALFQFAKQLGTNYWGASNLVGGQFNQPRAVLERWQMPGDQTSIQRPTTGQYPGANQAYRNRTQSDVAISDASFIRLKDVSVSYELSKKEDLGLGCTVFLRGQNLWTWTRFKGLDPETRSNSSVPTLRFITLGTRLTF